MSARPTVFPEWATTLSNNGPLGGPSRVEPSGSDKATGFLFPQQPPREWFNWLLFTNYEWLKYLDEELISGGASSFAQNNAATTGLTFAYRAGAYVDQYAKTLTEVAAGTIALTASDTNWIVYRPGTGITKVVGAWSGSTTGDVPLWKAITGASTITSIVDVRTVVNRSIHQMTATDRLLGRSTAGGGDVEEIVCTAAGRALLDDADAAAQRITLGATTAGSAIFTAADAAAQRTAMGAAASGLTTASGLTLPTARLVGRTSAGTGALENISIDSTMTLTGGILSAVQSGATLEQRNAMPRAVFRASSTAITNSILDNVTFVSVTHDNVANTVILRVDLSGVPSLSTSPFIVDASLPQVGQYFYTVDQTVVDANTLDITFGYFDNGLDANLSTWFLPLVKIWIEE